MALGRLDTGVPQEKLDLLEGPPGTTTELGAGPPMVMGCEFEGEGSRVSVLGGAEPRLLRRHEWGRRGQQSLAWFYEDAHLARPDV